MTKEDINFYLTSNDDWFDTKLLIYFKKGCDNKQCIKDKTYWNAAKVVFNKLKIFNTCFVHFGHGIGPIEMELKQVEPQYIKNLGNKKPYTQDKWY